MFKVEGSPIAANTFKEAATRYMEQYIDGDEADFCDKELDNIEVDNCNGCKKVFEVGVKQVYKITARSINE